MTESDIASTVAAASMLQLVRVGRSEGGSGGKGGDIGEGVRSVGE